MYERCTGVEQNSSVKHSEAWAFGMVTSWEEDCGWRRILELNMLRLGQGIGDILGRGAPGFKT